MHHSNVIFLLRKKETRMSWDRMKKVKIPKFSFQSNETVKVVPAPRFSVDIFFGFLTCMMVISLFAFLLLNFWPGCTEEHAENRLMVATHDELENQRLGRSNS